ncbi:helix-turn-helix domain-containing protein [Acerihabitans arboris]|uniref:Helix-turn-helix domain-containing protein n=1 Tax=Acerihabitans arboris TaxID=2691583 RepID=A0A845SSY6_9GAMM|nr:helix-turn-helix domain-containing protein [Acerihabitans arboris]NDL65838.1 helix-turn-helix domain-containing protein [Acerihabitans arboris]
MNVYDVIFDLVKWIEARLNIRLSIDMVAVKSGYSKWYLQRLFKDITGCGLSSYIRRRKLSMAALELRMTFTPILDIAQKYNFNSQRTFIRAFNHYFRQSPEAYRNCDEWDCSLLYPPCLKNIYPVLQPAVVSLPHRLLEGVTHCYRCLPENIDQFDMEIRNDFWFRHFKHVTDFPWCIYGLSELGPDKRMTNMLNITYITAVETPIHLSSGKKRTAVKLEGGDYIRFDYAGTTEGFQPFIIAVNQHHLPRLGVMRRKGSDIEQYYFWERGKSSWRTSFLNCSYFIPCANASAVDVRLRDGFEKMGRAL